MSKHESLTTEQLVDKFILSTGGECDPVRYRQAMIEFWEREIDEARGRGYEAGVKHERKQ